MYLCVITFFIYYKYIFSKIRYWIKQAKNAVAVVSGGTILYYLEIYTISIITDLILLIIYNQGSVIIHRPTCNTYLHEYKQIQPC